MKIYDADGFKINLKKNPQEYYLIGEYPPCARRIKTIYPNGAIILEGDDSHTPVYGCELTAIMPLYDDLNRRIVVGDRVRYRDEPGDVGEVLEINPYKTNGIRVRLNGEIHHLGAQDLIVQDSTWRTIFSHENVLLRRGDFICSPKHPKTIYQVLDAGDHSANCGIAHAIRVTKNPKQFEVKDFKATEFVHADQYRQTTNNIEPTPEQECCISYAPKSAIAQTWTPGQSAESQLMPRWIKMAHWNRQLDPKNPRYAIVEMYDGEMIPAAGSDKFVGTGTWHTWMPHKVFNANYTRIVNEDGYDRCVPNNAIHPLWIYQGRTDAMPPWIKSITTRLDTKPSDPVHAEIHLDNGQTIFTREDVYIAKTDHGYLVIPMDKFRRDYILLG